MPNLTLTDILEGRHTTTGADTVAILGELGALFTLCQPVTERTHGKEPIGFTWRDEPRRTEQALAHIRANRGRNNVGILTGCNGWVTFDCDRMAAEFLLGAALDDGFIVHRANATDRCKVLVLCSDPEGLPDTVTTIGATDAGGNFLEASGRRSNAIVAGTHHTGAAVLMSEGRVIVRTSAQIAKIVEDYRQWLGEHGQPIAANTPKPPPFVPSNPSQAATTGTTSGRVDWQALTHQAIEWAIGQGMYSAEVGRLLGASRRAGGAIALRPEKVPSTRRTDIRDGFHKATYRDFGPGKTYDDFELAVMASGRDRRELVNEALDEYLQATQGRTLADLRESLAVAKRRKEERQARDMALMAGAPIRKGQTA